MAKKRRFTRIYARPVKEELNIKLDISKLFHTGLGLLIASINNLCVYVCQWPPQCGWCAYLW